MPTEAPRSADTRADRPSEGLEAASISKLRALDPTGGTAFLGRVLSTYQRSLVVQVEAMRKASEEGDLAGVSSAAHALKSASASVGALEMARLCAALEAVVREGSKAAVPGLVSEFMGETVRVEAAVRAELALAAAASVASAGGAAP